MCILLFTECYMFFMFFYFFFFFFFSSRRRHTRFDCDWSSDVCSSDLSPRTANDDQPGPTGRRQISTGGDALQSVSMRMLRTMPSRNGPRNPGHSAGFAAETSGAALRTSGVSGTGAVFVGSGVFSTAGVVTAAGFTGSDTTGAGGGAIG